MPTTATTTFGNNRVVPYYRADKAEMQNYTFPPSTTLAKGTVVGEVVGNEVQTVTVTGGPTGGTFTLTFSGQTTGTIAYNAAGATVQTALRALSNIGAAGVTVTGAGPYTVTFTGPLGGQDVPLMTANATGLTGGTPGVTVTTATAGIAGRAGAYATGNTDGTQNPKGVLEYDLVVDAAGNHQWGGGMWGDTLGYAPVFVGGCKFRCEDLTGLDAGAVAAGSRLQLVSGSINIGIVALP